VADTKERLVAGALETIRREGIAGVSARTIAATSGVNQALIFYHFRSVDELIAVACRTGTASRLGHYRERLAAVTTLRELLDLGRALHAEERQAGNVTVLGQVLAGAQMDSRLIAPTKDALAMWTREIEAVLRRVLADSPLSEIADPAALAVTVSAAFIGLELYEGVDPDGATAALEAIEQLAVLVDVVESLGPVARRALRARTRRVVNAARPDTDREARRSPPRDGSSPG
jgi:AcrR family transcriptional regulator